MKNFNISVSPLESTACLATIHSYLTHLVYISFLLAQKQIKSWSQGIQKSRKYKGITIVTSEEIQYFSVPLESITCQATIHSYLTVLVYKFFLLARKRNQSWLQGFQKNGKYKMTTTVTNEAIQHFSAPSGIHHLPSYYSFLFDKSSVYSLSFGSKVTSALVTGDSEKWEI